MLNLAMYYSASICHSTRTVASLKVPCFESQCDCTLENLFAW